MTSPPRRVQVECPNCRTSSSDFIRDSINLSLGETWTDEEIDEATPTTCPQGGHGRTSDALIIHLARE